MHGLGSTFNVKTFPKLSERSTSFHCFQALHRHLVSIVWFERAVVPWSLGGMSALVFSGNYTTLT